MNRAILQACLPWLAMLVVLVAAVAGLVRLNGSRLRLGRLITLHADQDGGSQSLSFVMTLPVFILFLILILQVSQLMIGTVVIHYAAFAAARTAVVWIPAQVGDATNGYGGEYENCININPPYIVPDPNAVNVLPAQPFLTTSGPTPGGMTFVLSTASAVSPTSVLLNSAACASSYKLSQVLNAAILACLPMSPSDNKGLSIPTETWPINPGSLADAFNAMAPMSGTQHDFTWTVSNSAVSNRLQQKLAWAANNTTIELRFYHANGCDVNGNIPENGGWVSSIATIDPPLGVELQLMGLADLCPYPVGVPYPGPNQTLGVEQPYPLGQIQPDPPPNALWDYQLNEIGWQDSITVTVHHNFALLPFSGPVLQMVTGGFGSTNPNSVIGQVNHTGSTYYILLTGQATLGLEGEKSAVPYVYQ